VDLDKFNVHKVFIHVLIKAKKLIGKAALTTKGMQRPQGTKIFTEWLYHLFSFLGTFSP